MSDLPMVAERLLRYVAYDTQSDEASETSPSTAKQLELARLLVDELKALELEDVELDDHGTVTATCRGNVDHEPPTIGLLAHMDTSPEMSGAGVTPRVHSDYDGGPLALSEEYTLTPDRSPELKDHIGHTIITTDGRTLLGADNKAGIAEIMTLLSRLREDPAIPHGTIRVAFTCDEEIGRGADHFDVEGFGADFAYTVDGATVGQIENETFCADSAELFFSGVNVHPGTAKGQLVNALKMAARFVESLPPDLCPERTEDREGFVHPVSVEGGVDRAAVKLILRDFELLRLEGHRALVSEIAERVEKDFPGGRIDVEFEESYRNMRFVLDDHPQVVELALAAVRRAGLEPRLDPIRGGTDGARLSYMGLPTPNIFTGGHLYHSRFEWVAVEGMLAAVETLVQLVQLAAERPA